VIIYFCIIDVRFQSVTEMKSVKPYIAVFTGCTEIFTAILTNCVFKLVISLRGVINTVSQLRCEQWNRTNKIKTGAALKNGAFEQF
jgi:hypothetical protein